MKTGTSSLNPYAASYIPLFKRGGADADKQLSSTKELNRGLDTFRSGQGQHLDISQSHGQTNYFSQWKDHHGSSEWTSRYSDKNPQKSELDGEMDMAYLEMMFPGVSDESLHGVYFANKCDLDAAVDMLNQLEIPINPGEDDSSDKLLPDTLDIGDVPESGPQKVINKEAIGGGGVGGASTSGSSNLP